jgi:amino acid transporter
MATEINNKNRAALGVFKLVMIAIISVDSIRNLPIAAQYGTALITFYLIAGIAFFYPLIKVSSFLANRYPNTGGSYLWIQDAFGPYWGFLSIWLQWIYNVIWYPTIFAFMSTTLAVIFSPVEAQSNLFILITSLVLFWAITLINCFGIRAIGWVSTISTVLGTLIPMAFIIGVAAYWLLSGHPSATPLSFHGLIPTQANLSDLGFFTNILFSLLGIEVIAMHAGDVNNPARSYPRALMISGIVILTSLILSSLALCILIPADQIGLIGGVMDAFTVFFNTYHLSWVTQLMGIAIIIGGLGIATSWISGLARGLRVASLSSRLPSCFQTLNRHDMPQAILIAQACIFTALTSLFLFSSNLQHSYWLLSNMTAQFALLFYVILFCAALRLFRRAKQSLIHQFWIIIGILISLAGIGIGFIPPASLINHEAIVHYELTLIGGELLFLLPILFFLKRRPIVRG